jgi:hypothetical protein
VLAEETPSEPPKQKKPSPEYEFQSDELGDVWAVLGELYPGDALFVGVERLGVLLEIDASRRQLVNRPLHVLDEKGSKGCTRLPGVLGRGVDVDLRPSSGGRWSYLLVLSALAEVRAGEREAAATMLTELVRQLLADGDPQVWV